MAGKPLPLECRVCGETDPERLVKRAAVASGRKRLCLECHSGDQRLRDLQTPKPPPDPYVLKVKAARRQTPAAKAVQKRANDRLTQRRKQPGPDRDKHNANRRRWKDTHVEHERQYFKDYRAKKKGAADGS